MPVDVAKLFGELKAELRTAELAAQDCESSVYELRRVIAQLEERISALGEG